MGERRYLNGAVIRLDRKATIELLSDAAFLLETHVIQASEATTPLRRVYFVVQVMLMDPAAAGPTMDLLHQLIDKALLAFETPEIKKAERRNRRLASRLRGQSHDRIRCLFDHRCTVVDRHRRARRDQPAQL